MTFLFWNIKKKPLQENIRRLVSLHNIDVLMLAEFSIEPDALLKVLNQQDAVKFHYAPGNICRKIEIFSRFTSKFIMPVYESDRLTVRHLKMPAMTDILLAVGHFSSKNYWSNPSQASECFELSQDIREAEEKVGHSRTVLVGDFNMNPFEDGMIGANGFNAVMSRHIAERRSRVVQSRTYPFFYNPMWSLLGDASPGPSGTYYDNRSEHINFFWYMF